jgi:hypothetical protein
VINAEASSSDSNTTSPNDLDLIMSVHDSISLGLDFSHGNTFAEDVRSKFLSEVHPSDKFCNFTMVVSFGRSNFKLSED